MRRGETRVTKGKKRGEGRRENKGSEGKNIWEVKERVEVKEKKGKSNR